MRFARSSVKARWHSHLVLLPLLLLLSLCSKEKADDFSSFAKQIEKALERRDAQFFVNRAQTFEQICDLTTGSIGVVKVGCQTGDAVKTFGIASGCGGAALVLADYELLLAEWFENLRPHLSDEYGTGAVRLYATARSPAGSVAIVTSINEYPAGDPRRFVSVFGWQRLDGRWRLVNYAFHDAFRLHAHGSVAYRSMLRGLATLERLRNDHERLYSLPRSRHRR